MSLRSDASFAINGQRALDLGRFKFRPVTANVQWHFMRNGVVSPYVGAGLAYIKASDLSSSDLDVAGIGRIRVGNKTNWDANAGLNFNIGPRFAIAIDGKYIPWKPTSTGSGGSQKLKLNPTVVSGGVKVKF
jgi:outer membrane protein W